MFFAPLSLDLHAGLHGRVVTLFKPGLTSGTWKNKLVQFKCYKAFSKSDSFNPEKPSMYNVMRYIAHLYSFLKSAGAINNYLSGARTWVLLHKGDTTNFDLYPVTLVKRGAYKLLSHKPIKALPLLVTDKRYCHFLH